MPRSAAPNWRKRTPLVLGDKTYDIRMIDEYVRESVRQADGKYDPVTGWYKLLVIPGVENLEYAWEIEKRLRAAAFYHFRNEILEIGIHVSRKKQPDGTYNVEFVAVNKDHTYAYMIMKYGEDQSKWPYSPYKFHPNYNSSSSAKED